MVVAIGAGAVVWLLSDLALGALFSPTVASPHLYVLKDAVLLAALIVGLILAYRQQRRQSDALQADLRRAAMATSEPAIVTFGQRTVATNAAFQRLIGCEAGTSRGNLLLAAVHTDDRQRVADLYERAQTATGQTSDAPFRILAEDLSLRWVQASLYPIPWQAQSGTLTLLTDVTTDDEQTSELARSEGLYRSTIDAIESLVHVVDADLRVLLANRSMRSWYEHMVKKGPPEGQNLFAVFPFLPQKVADEYRQVFETGRPIETDETTELSGEILLTHTSKLPIINQGRVVRVVTIIRDVTESIQNRQRLQTSLQSQITLNEMSGAVGAARDLQQAYRIINRQLSSLTRYVTLRIYGPIEDGAALTLACELERGLERDVRQRAALSLVEQAEHLACRAFRSGEPLWESDSDDPEGQRTTRALYLPMKVLQQPVGVIELVGSGRADISLQQLDTLCEMADVAAIGLHRLEMYQEARARAERLAVVNRISRATSSILEPDALLETIYCEIAAVLGDVHAAYIGLYDAESDTIDYRLSVDDGEHQEPSRQSLEGSWAALVIRGDAPLLVSDVRASMASMPQAQLFGSQRAPGTWLGVPMRIGSRITGVISVQSYQVDAFDQDDLNLLSTIADQVAIAIENARLYDALRVELTERERIEEHLRHTSKLEAVGTLAGGVAHDFNNLLTVINGFSQYALESIPANDPLSESLSEIHAAGQRAAALTRQLLAFGRRQVLSLTVLDLNEVIERTRGMLSHLLDPGIALRFELQPDLWSVLADAGQMEQVLVNLIVNARDAVADRDDGEIIVRSENVVLEPTSAQTRAGAWVGEFACISVSDNGTGIPPEIIDRIFEPFFTTKEVGKGSGLGLSTVYGIIKQSHGNILAENLLGGGCRFTIHMPRETSAPTPLASPPSEDAGSPQGDETILLVEDEDGVGNLVQRQISQLGYRVLRAANGTEGIGAFQSASDDISLVLSDITMPSMTGPEMVAALRKIGYRGPVLYLSGHGDQDVAQDDIAIGDVPLLAKPFSRAQLARTIREILDTES